MENWRRKAGEKGVENKEIFVVKWNLIVVMVSIEIGRAF